MKSTIISGTVRRVFGFSAPKGALNPLAQTDRRFTGAYGRVFKALGGLAVTFGLAFGLFIASGGPVELRAQVGDDGRQYLLLNELGRTKVRMSGFASPTFEVGLMDGKLGMFAGAAGGFVLQNKFYIGGYGQSLVNQSAWSLPEDEYQLPKGASKLSMSHYGLFAAYSWKTFAIVHPTLSLRAGMGNVKWRVSEAREAFFQRPELHNIDGATLTVIQPQFGVEVSVTKMLRIGFELGYRHVMGYEDKVPALKDGSLSGPLANLGLRFGGFY